MQDKHEAAIMDLWARGHSPQQIADRLGAPEAAQQVADVVQGKHKWERSTETMTETKPSKCYGAQDHEPETMQIRTFKGAAINGMFRTYCTVCGAGSEPQATAGQSVTQFLQRYAPEGAPLMLTKRTAYIGLRVEVWQHPNVQPAPHQGETGTIRAFCSFGPNNPGAGVEIDAYGSGLIYIPLGELIRTGEPDDDPRPEYASPVEQTAIERGIAEYLGESADMEGGISVSDGMDRGGRLTLEGFEVVPAVKGFAVSYRDRDGKPKRARIKVIRGDAEG